MRHPALCREEQLFQPLWSKDILDELRRNLLRHGVGKPGVDHRIEQMTRHFPGAMVTGHDSLVEAMTNHPKDRHVPRQSVSELRGGVPRRVPRPVGSVIGFRRT